MATVRREIRIDRSPDEVWAVITDPVRIAEWFPGVASATLDEAGEVRTITLGSGIPMPERIITNDSILRRFQYRIEAGLFREHLGTIDVLDDSLDGGPERSLVVYSTDAEPRVMALVVGGATGSALKIMKQQLENN